MAIKIMIADGNTLIRQGIKRIIDFEPDLEVIGEAATGKKALDMTVYMKPDVLIIDPDIDLPNPDRQCSSGSEIAQRLLENKSETKIIALTIHSGDNYVLELLKNNVKGYLLKNLEPPMLVEAIRRVNEGEYYIASDLEQRIFGQLEDGDDIGEKAREMWKDNSLTNRELEVIRCIAQGFNNQTIAQELFLSPKTVKNHLSSIFKKLNVKDRTMALVEALKSKMIDLE